MMANRRALWEQAATTLFDSAPGTSAAINLQTRTAANVIFELEKARILELKKWWEMTSLTKYIESGCVPRGLRILILPTLGDIDPDLLEQWRFHTSDCSAKLMDTLITQSKRRMEEQTHKIEQLTKELEKMGNSQEIQQLLVKMEERITKKEDEIKTRKALKFNRDKKDYEVGRIYTFARKYNTLRAQDKIATTDSSKLTANSVDDSSDLSSSADEAPANKLDFHGEMRLLQSVMPQSNRSRGRSRGGTRRGGGRGRNYKHQD
ncbi:hypothetical protein NDU88_009412 [Pleurodeles waltl]|uniref:Uncharacterized protein n=1 Tax=Pleurodeles waltl TaxID=8319 RepID=A0AAV7QRI7_PLEWA|nr:hypothetical protein NDU88_009412 [Pleurodeles waltl]